MARREDFKTTRKGEDSATYRVLYLGGRTDWTVARNDNELEAGGNPSIAWCLTHDEHGVLHEDRTRGECLDDLALRYARRKPLLSRY